MTILFFILNDVGPYGLCMVIYYAHKTTNRKIVSKIWKVIQSPQINLRPIGISGWICVKNTLRVFPVNFQLALLVRGFKGSWQYITLFQPYHSVGSLSSIKDGMCECYEIARECYIDLISVHQMFLERCQLPAVNRILQKVDAFGVILKCGLWWVFVKYPE